MELIADILLVAGALGAGFYCFILSHRLRRFTDLEKGVGGAVSVLSSQADELRKSLDTARTASDDSGAALRDLTERAETVAQRLELMMASMHDVVPKSPAETSDHAEEPPAEADQTPEAEVDASEPDAVSDPEPSGDTAEEPTKKPKGVMFFRHAGVKGAAGS